MSELVIRVKKVKYKCDRNNMQVYFSAEFSASSNCYIYIADKYCYQHFNNDSLELREYEKYFGHLKYEKRLFTIIFINLFFMYLV